MSINLCSIFPHRFDTRRIASIYKYYAKADGYICASKCTVCKKWITLKLQKKKDKVRYKIEKILD